jgi:hypothetical protein
LALGEHDVGVAPVLPKRLRRPKRCNRRSAGSRSVMSRSADRSMPTSRPMSRLASKAVLPSRRAGLCIGSALRLDLRAVRTPNQSEFLRIGFSEHGLSWQLTRREPVRA